MVDNIIDKRSNLIIDYLSQILVYGSNTKGEIAIERHDFDDGKYLVLTVAVIKNNYFRWHDLGIRVGDSLNLYKDVIHKIGDKFKEFSITKSNNEIIIASDVNKNKVIVKFNLQTKKDNEWFNNFKI